MLARVVPTGQPVAHAEDSEGDHLGVADRGEAAVALALLDQGGPHALVVLPDALHRLAHLGTRAHHAIAQADRHLQAMAVEALEVVADGEVQLLWRRHALGHHGLHAVDQGRGLRADDGQQDFRAAAEVVVQRLALDAHRLAHVVERGVDETLAVEQVDRRAQDGLAAQIGLARLCARGRGVGGHEMFGRDSPGRAISKGNR